MCSSFEDHVSSLDQTFIYKFVAAFRGFARLSTAGEEYSAFFVFHRHKVGRYLYIDHIAPIRVRLEIVHEQVVGVVYEKMKSVDHLSVIANQRHFNCLFYDFYYGLLSFLFFLE